MQIMMQTLTLIFRHRNIYWGAFAVWLAFEVPLV
jgi:hypothetical protein